MSIFIAVVVVVVRGSARFNTTRRKRHLLLISLSFLHEMKTFENGKTAKLLKQKKKKTLLK